MTAFLEATKPAPWTLLLPAATEQEITRHIQEQVDAASKVLSDAKRRAPILAKWTGWPANLDARDTRWQLHAFAQGEWKALGECECKVAFDARVSYSASVSFDDPNSLVGDSEDGYFALRRLSGTVSDSSEISGVTKLKLDAAGENVLGVIRLEFDDDNVCVTGIPENGWSDDWEDDDRSEEES
jgi:hypothetical protein